MKKLIALAALTAGFAFAAAQVAPKTKEEDRKTSTIPEKIHNVVSPHKEHNGHKIKKKTRHGRKFVKKVNYKKGTVTYKTKKAGSPDKKVVTEPLHK